MRFETLLELDTDRYLTLVKAVVGSECLAWFEATDGTVVAGQAPTSSEASWATHCITLADHLKQPLATLQVACTDGQRLAAAHGNIALVTQSLVEELRLNYDLDCLTEELTDRYEDLNLVFDNQEVATGLVDLQTALSQLADNAVSHLTQGLALIVFPDRDVEIFRHQDVAEYCDMDGLRQLAVGSLWSFMRRQTGTLVLNTDSTSDGLQICSDYGFKVLLSPIHHGRDDAIGYLLLAKADTAENFSNGDRRIADVICQNAQSVLAAHFDTLTGLLQRGAFVSELAQAMASDRHRRQPHVLVFISVDRTTVINDAFGRATGDLLLQQVAKVIDRNVRRADSVARLGGDEFAVLLKDAGPRDAQRLAESISSAVQGISLGVLEGTPSVSVSIGISPVAVDETPDAVLSQAQIARDKAREGGGGKVHLFDNENELMAERHAQSQMVTLVQAALANDQFELFCQPIVALHPDVHGRHFEVLLRMRDGVQKVIPPSEFLPVAERYSLLPQIDRWVIRNTLKALSESSFLVVAPDTVCAINLSGQSLSDRQFLDFVLDAVDEFGVAPQCVCFEITETAAINDLQMAQLFITELRGRGFRFSLDDFGTGLSSFTYLQQMPVDYLKIDGSFVSKITTDPISRAMVQAIADVAEAMQVRTVGEFVEDEAIRDALAQMGITYGQGYLFSRPIPIAQHFASILDDVGREMGV